jgi:FMN reductase
VSKPIHIVGLGGTTRVGSTSELALRACLNEAKKIGARTELFCGSDLILPLFDPCSTGLEPAAARLLAAMRSADGFIIASPGYHGSVSGLVKNALDYTELMRDDERPYFDGRAVGSIVCAHGWQAVGTSLVTLRSIVHALRGWPTPLGIGINSADSVFGDGGDILAPSLAANLSLVAEQVVRFARFTLDSRR